MSRQKRPESPSVQPNTFPAQPFDARSAASIARATPVRPPRLTTATANKILNGWDQNVLLEEDSGMLWASSEGLHVIFDTQRPQAKRYVAAVPAAYKRDFSYTDEHGASRTITYVQAWHVAAHLGRMINDEANMPRRRRLEYSEAIYLGLRNSPEVTILRVERLQVIEARGGLKNARIREFNLTADELTNANLARDAQFSHIVAVSVAPLFADRTWNGLVVNVDTHAVITAAGVMDHEGLLHLCKERGWNQDWYTPFVSQAKASGLELGTYDILLE